MNVDTSETSDVSNIYAEFGFGKGDMRSVGVNGAYFTAEAFVEHNGRGLPFIRQHGWDDDPTTLGAGRITATNEVAAFKGELHKTTKATEFAIEYEGLERNGVGSVSIAFWPVEGHVRTGQALTPDEKEMGVIVAFDKVVPIELSFVDYPNIEAANITINSIVNADIEAQARQLEQLSEERRERDLENTRKYREYLNALYR